MIATTASAATIGQPPTRERTPLAAAGLSGLPRRWTRTTSRPSGGGFALECVGSAFPGNPPGAAQHEAAPGQRGNGRIGEGKQQTEQRRDLEMPSGADLNPDY